MVYGTSFTFVECGDTKVNKHQI